MDFKALLNTSEYDGGMGVQICNGYEEAGKTGWTKDVISDLKIGCVLEDNHYGKSATIQRVA